jgi:hypothetical protein
MRTATCRTKGPYARIIALCLVGAACSSSPTDEGASDPCALLPVIAVGESKSGSLGSSDCIQEDGAFGDRWRLSVSPAADIRIDLESPGFEGVIELRDGSGNVIGVAVDPGGIGDARIIQPLPASTYTLLVRPTYSGQAGNYTLSVSLAPSCAPVGSLGVGQTVSGSLQEGDCIRQWEGRADNWSLSVSSPQKLRLDLESADFDEILLLSTPEGYVWWGSDWNHPSGHARADVTLEPGEWTLTVTTPLEQTRGSYQLAVALQPPCAPGTDLSLGETVTGSLDADACLLESYLPADSFAITLAEETPVRFHLKSLDFEPLVVVRDGTGTDVAVGYDQLDDGNAVARAGLVPGKYSIYVAGWPAEGDFTLTVEEISCETGSVAFGETVTGTLSGQDCVRSGGQSQDLWELVLASDATVRIDLTSTQFDPWLVLQDEAGGVIATDDDSGVGVSARIERALTTGTYLISASSFGPEGAGAYQLAVAAPPASTVSAAPTESLEAKPLSPRPRSPAPRRRRRRPRTGTG